MLLCGCLTIAADAVVVYGYLMICTKANVGDIVVVKKGPCWMSAGIKHKRQFYVLSVACWVFNKMWEWTWLVEIIMKLCTDTI